MWSLSMAKWLNLYSIYIYIYIYIYIWDKLKKVMASIWLSCSCHVSVIMIVTSVSLWLKLNATQYHDLYSMIFDTLVRRSGLKLGWGNKWPIEIVLHTRILLCLMTRRLFLICWNFEQCLRQVRSDYKKIQYCLSNLPPFSQHLFSKLESFE